MLPLTVNVPLVSVSVPSTVTSPSKLIPFPRLIVRLFKVTAGRFVPSPEPPNEMFEEAPPFNEPEEAEIALLSVNVFAPIDKAPFVKVKVPVNCNEFCKVVPLELLSVKLFNSVILLGMITPLPLPDIVIDDVLPALKLEGVPAIVFL